MRSPTQRASAGSVDRAVGKTSSTSMKRSNISRAARAPPRMLIQLTVCNSHEVEERCDCPGGVQIVIQSSLHISFNQRRDFFQRLISCLVTSLTEKSLTEFPQALNSLRSSRQRFVIEIYRLTIMGLKEQQSDSRGIDALLSQIARG